MSVQNKNLSFHAHQGIALPTILILLLVMTLLGVATLNSTVFEEKMSANHRLRQVAFNSAESALRFGELHAQRIRSVIRTGPLPVESGAPTSLFVGGPSGQNSNWPQIDAINNDLHPGDSCTGGYCTPKEYHLGPVKPINERWQDPVLDVWNDVTKHHEFTDFASTSLSLEGAFEAPKYIIEYMGDYPESAGALNCDFTSTPPPNPNSGRWPFCIADPALFRITARAVAGFPGREVVVILQSTIRVP